MRIQPGVLIGLCIVLQKTYEEVLEIYNDLAENAHKNGVFGETASGWRDNIS